MEIKAEQKYILSGPRKIRLVAEAIRGLSPVVAVERLAMSNKRAAGVLGKVVKQALANAKHNFKLDVEKLVFGEIQVLGGPLYKRVRAGARGVYKPYARRTAHVRVVLATRGLDEKVERVKSLPKVVRERIKGAKIGKVREGESEMMKEEAGVKRGGVRQVEVRQTQRRTTHK